MEREGERHFAIAGTKKGIANRRLGAVLSLPRTGGERAAVGDVAAKAAGAARRAGDLGLGLADLCLS